MINKTNGPILVSSETSANAINLAIREALNYTIRAEAQYWGSGDGSPVLKIYGNLTDTFASLMLEQLNTQEKYDFRFIEAAFEYTQTSKARQLEKAVSEHSVLSKLPFKIQTKSGVHAPAA